MVKGNFLEKYHIQTQKTVTHVVNTPRDVPFTVMPKLKANLDCILQDDAIIPLECAMGESYCPYETYELLLTTTITIRNWKTPLQISYTQGHHN